MFEYINELQSYLSPDISAKVVRTIIILIGAFLVRILGGLVIRSVIKKFEDNNPSISRKEQRVFTLTNIIRSTINIIIIIITGLMVLSQWQIDIAPILTGAGILGLAVGFGSQKLVHDIVTGFFILLENTFNIGDTIVVSNIEGKVVEMNLRTTVLKDPEGNIYTVPNSSISSVKKIKTS